MSRDGSIDRITLVLNDAWHSPLRQRIKLAWAVLRGQQTWSDGYPTPWAYEQVCKAYNDLRWPKEARLDDR